MLVGQGLCAYTLWKKKEKQTWRESASVFLILSIGAAIALVSQIYHLQGDMQGFLLIWITLVLPVVYIMTSSVASLLYIAGTFFFTVAPFDTSSELENPLLNWLLIGLIIPYYFYIIKNRFSSNATSFHHWFIPITVIIATTYSLTSAEYAIAPVMIAQLGLFYMIGHLKRIKPLRLFANGYLVIGALGTIGMFLDFTFSGYWNWTVENEYSWIPETVHTMIIAAIIMCISVVLFAKHLKAKTFNVLTPIMPIFLIFIVLILIARISPETSQLLTNSLVLAIAVLTIKSGVEQDHLGILNYGLIIITTLLICRFFDTDLNFVLRRLLFIVVGVSYFITNNILLKKRKAND
ncbi:MAG: putative membrane protein [Saprospiraceae bacterium]